MWANFIDGTLGNQNFDKARQWAQASRGTLGTGFSHPNCNYGNKLEIGHLSPSFVPLKASGSPITTIKVDHGLLIF